MKNWIIIFYCVFLFFFSIFSYAFVDQNLSHFKNVYTGFAFDDRLLTTIFYIISICIFLIFYGIFVLRAVSKSIKLKDAFVLIAITAGVLFFSYPAMLSYDIFNYLMTSKVLFVYHENPYIIMPIEFTGDPLLAFTHAANKIALYGPFWVFLTGIPYLSSFGNFVITLFSLKFLTLFFYLITIFMIWKISKNITSLILFSLNPLVVIETLVSGHNDIVMISLVLIAFYLFPKKKIFLATLFFVSSIFIKYTTILLLPVFLFLLWRSIERREVNWNNIFYYCSLLMYVGFLLSPIREEIYPWYAIWFLSFSFLIPNRKLLLYISVTFSFGLLFRYVPFMFSGTHAGLTTVIKSIVTFLPPFLVGFYFALKEKLWERIFSR